MTAPATFLDVDRVSKHFGKQVALRQVSCSFTAGESVAVAGANGAGKSTLLRILATLSRPSRGNYQAFGVDAWTGRTEVRTRIGVVGHQPFVYPELTCQENLRYFGSMYSVDRLQRRIEGLLTQVGLASRQDQQAGTLSRGLLQRLDLARAMLHNPAVLVLDEPDTGLDVPGQRILGDLIEEQTSLGGAAIFSTHDLEFAVARAGRIIVLRDGEIIHDQPAESTPVAELESWITQRNDAARV